MADLYFKYGTMNSGKSISLMCSAHNYEEVGYKVLVMKPKIDTKGNDKLQSRVNIERKVDILIEENASILPIIREKLTNKLSCIFVDEAQFLNTRQIDELFFITKSLDIPVICYGLRNNFKMEGFDGSTRLLLIADRLEELTTLCECRSLARFVGRKVDGKFVKEGNTVEIDGSKGNMEYIPMCGKCYLKKVKNLQL